MARELVVVHGKVHPSAPARDSGQDDATPDRPTANASGSGERPAPGAQAQMLRSPNSRVTEEQRRARRPLVADPSPDDGLRGDEDASAAYSSHADNSRLDAHGVPLIFRHRALVRAREAQKAQRNSKRRAPPGFRNPTRSRHDTGAQPKQQFSSRTMNPARTLPAHGTSSAATEDSDDDPSDTVKSGP